LSEEVFIFQKSDVVAVAGVVKNIHSKVIRPVHFGEAESV
jgi:hypothetical protein